MIKIRVSVTTRYVTTYHDAGFAEAKKRRSAGRPFIDYINNTSTFDNCLSTLKHKADTA